jgi:hypothetical protein
MMDAVHLLAPAYVREIDQGRYTLFGRECPQPVMAAYERLWATRGRSRRAQEDGDALMAWVVSTTLLDGDHDLGVRLVEALEALGWRRGCRSS